MIKGVKVFVLFCFKKFEKGESRWIKSYFVAVFIVNQMCLLHCYPEALYKLQYKRAGLFLCVQLRLLHLREAAAVWRVFVGERGRRGGGLRQRPLHPGTRQESPRTAGGGGPLAPTEPRRLPRPLVGRRRGGGRGRMGGGGALAALRTGSYERSTRAIL